MGPTFLLSITIVAACYALFEAVNAVNAMGSEDSLVSRITYITAAVTAAGTLLCPLFYPGKLGYIEAALVVSLAAVMALPQTQRKETH